jgi:hypothetical protein
MDHKEQTLSAKDQSLISENSFNHNLIGPLQKKASFNSANLEFLYHERYDDFGSLPPPPNFDPPSPYVNERILDEHALFSQIFKNKGAGQLSRMLSNLYFYLIYTIVCQIFMGLLVINFFEDPNDNSRGLFVFLFASYAIKAVIYAVVMKGWPVRFREGTYYKMDLIWTISYLPIWLGCVLYLSKTVTIYRLWLFVLPQLAFCAYSDYLYGNKKLSWLKLMAKIRFIEPVQNLFIFLNLAYRPISNWGFGLTYYYAYAVFMIVVSTISAILSIVFVFFVFFASKEKFKDLLMVCYMGPIVFYLIWIGYLTYFAFIGIKHFFYIHGFQQTAIAKSQLSGDLLSAAIWAVFLGVVTLLWMAVSYFTLNKWIVKYFVTNKYLNSLSRLSYDLNFGVKVMSDFYFKKQGPSNRSRTGSYSKEETELFIARKALTECIFCYQKNADILIQPCGHAGICGKCIKESLAKNNKCPFCDEKIKSIRMIVYDDQTKAFIATNELEIEPKKIIQVDEYDN